jgi:HPt (histidine-containing phosphotransfer) domain-containing protein
VTRHNPEMLKSLIAAELEESPRLMAAIRDAVAKGDRSQLRLAAHTLKGSVRYFGAEQLFQSAARLEELAKAGKPEEIGAIQHSLEREMEMVVAALRRRLDEIS